MSKKCPNCGHNHENKCLICGYDPATGKFKVSRKQLGLPAEDPGPWADIWIANFADEDIYSLYFEEVEQYEEGEYQSSFAEDMEISFYDHDFFATTYGINSLEAVAKEYFDPEMDLGEIQAALAASVHKDFNTVAMQLDELGPKPAFRTAKDKGYWVTYLGRFRYSPR